MSRKRWQRKYDYHCKMKAYAEYRWYIFSEPPRWKFISHWIWKQKRPKWTKEETDG